MVGDERPASTRGNRLWVQELRHATGTTWDTGKVSVIGAKRIAVWRTSWVFLLYFHVYYNIIYIYNIYICIYVMFFVFIPCAGPFITVFLFFRGLLRSLFARLVGCLGAQNLCSNSCGFELGDMQVFSAYQLICVDLYGQLVEQRQKLPSQNVTWDETKLGPRK